MKEPKNEFWMMSCRAGAGTRAEDKRWGLVAPELTNRVRFEYLDRLENHIGQIEPPPFGLTFEAERDTRVDDAPWPDESVFLVSDRFKSMLEAAGPDDCQYFPVDIRYKGKPIPHPYWALHVIHTVDCADPAKSYSTTGGTPGSVYHIRAAIIPEKVPPERAIFRIKDGAPTPCVRDSLKRALVKAKITGVMFYSP
jgi:hypothetical protein